MDALQPLPPPPRWNPGIDDNNLLLYFYIIADKIRNILRWSLTRDNFGIPSSEETVIRENERDR